MTNYPIQSEIYETYCIRGGLAVFDHPELMRNYPLILDKIDVMISPLSGTGRSPRVNSKSPKESNTGYSWKVQKYKLHAFWLHSISFCFAVLQQLQEVRRQQLQFQGAVLQTMCVSL